MPQKRAQYFSGKIQFFWDERVHIEFFRIMIVNL